MTTDLKPENETTSPIAWPRDTALRAAIATRPPFLKSRTALAIGVGSLGLIFGLLIDGGGSTQTTQAAVPATTVAQVSGTAPASCLKALDLAEEAISLAGNGFTVVSDSYSALAQGDFDTVTDSASELAGLTGQITQLTPDYQAAAASCRGL